MALPAGGGAFVRSAGGRCMAFAQHGLLRRGLLPHSDPSSAEATECSRARFLSDELRSRYGRHEWHGVVLHLLLPKSGPACTNSWRVFAARGKCRSRGG